MPTSRASAPGAATMERPTGRPSTVDPGRLTCGTPVRPPWAHRHRMRSRTRLERRLGLARARCGERRRGQTEDGAGRQQMRHPGARLAAHQLGPAPLALGDHRGRDQPAGHAEGHPRIVAVEPLAKGEPRLPRLQRPLGPRPHGDPLRGEQILARLAGEAGQRLHHRLKRGRDLRIGEAERVDGDDQPARACGRRSPPRA